MIRPHQALVVWGLGWLVGVLIAPFLYLHLLAVTGGLILTLASLLRPPSPAVKVIGILFLGIMLGWWRHQFVIETFPQPPSPLPTETVLLTGRVTSDPEFVAGQQRLHLQVTSIEGRPVNFRTRAFVFSLPRLSHGMIISGDFRLALPENFDGFDYVGYLSKDRISAIARSQDAVVITERSATFLGFLYDLRHAIDREITHLVPGSAGDLLSGLLLGMRSDLSEDFKTALQNSGTSHIVALSGLNVTIIIGILMILLQVYPRRIQFIMAGVMIVLFVVMSGASGSVVRAAIMGCVFLLSGLWGRRHYIWNGLILAVILMTALNPAIVSRDIGFQLSLFATIGMIWLAPLIMKLMIRLPRPISETVAATVAASVFTLPILLYNFEGFSSVGLVSNLLIVPIIPLAMAIGFGGLLLGLVLPLPGVVSVVVWLPLAWIEWVVNFFGHFPGAFLAVASPAPAWLVLYYLILGSLVYYWSLKNKDDPSHPMALATFGPRS